MQTYKTHLDKLGSDVSAGQIKPIVLQNMAAFIEGTIIFT